MAKTCLKLNFQSLKHPDAAVGRCLVFHKIDTLKNWAKFTWKQLCRSLFFNNPAYLQLQLYLKRDSDTGIFLWIRRNFTITQFLYNTSEQLVLSISEQCTFTRDLTIIADVSRSKFQLLWKIITLSVLWVNYFSYMSRSDKTCSNID